jgi:hypothetical protein
MNEADYDADNVNVDLARDLHKLTLQFGLKRIKHDLPMKAFCFGSNIATGMKIESHCWRH